MKILVACMLWAVLVVLMSSQGSLFEKNDKKSNNIKNNGSDDRLIPFTLLGTDLNDTEDMRKSG